MQTTLSSFEYPSLVPNRSFAAPKTNLPCPPTPLCGRTSEKAQACRLLAQTSVRLLTLTGPGGVGKTRLALDVGDDLHSHFPDGVWLLSLANVAEPEMLGFTLARTLALPRTAEQYIWQALKEFLGPKQLLLVLDNFEQIIEAAPRLAELLASCSGLKLLVTSRLALHLSAEHEMSIEPFGVPATSDCQTLEAVSRCEALEFFVQRGQAVRSDFQLTPENFLSVAQICTRLDGLPLALELAATWLRLLPPQTLLNRLEMGKGLQLLASGGPDLPVRQRSLRHNVVWSYDLLDETEQKLFRTLAVFKAGCELEEAERFGEALLALSQFTHPRPAVLELLGSLVKKNMLRQSEIRLCNGQVSVHLRMLETFREYGLELLEVTGELCQAQQLLGNQDVKPQVQSQVFPSKSVDRYALTRREQEVLRLLAEGLTDKAIAERLTISPRTVHAHLTVIYSKLAVTTRSAATRLALSCGLS